MPLGIKVAAANAHSDDHGLRLYLPVKKERHDGHLATIMAPQIYNSPYPSVPVVERSVYTHLFAADGDDPNLVGQFPGSTPAFIDAVSGSTITRADLKRLTLAFGYGIRNHPRTAAKRGDTILIYSANSLCWPVVLLGSGKLCFLIGNLSSSS